MKNKKQMGVQILSAMYCKYKAEIEYHRANIDIYLNTPAGIGEHSDILGAIDSELDKMSIIRGKVDTLRSEWDFDEDE